MQAGDVRSPGSLLTRFRSSEYSTQNLDSSEMMALCHSFIQLCLHITVTVFLYAALKTKAKLMLTELTGQAIAKVEEPCERKLGVLQTSLLPD